MSRHRTLGEPLTCYRIGDIDGDWPVFSGGGSRANPGRWNDVDQDMIYASQNCATAMLEKLARLSFLPPNQHYVAITAAAGTSYEELNEAKVPGWYEENAAAARAFGSRWFSDRRSAILIVPSVIVRMERNILINPHHADFARIKAGREMPIYWDPRMFDA